MLSLQIAIGIIIGSIVIDFIRKKGLDNILNSIFTLKGLKNVFAFVVSYLCLYRFIDKNTDYYIDEDNLFLLPQYLIVYIFLYIVNRKIPFKKYLTIVKEPFLFLLTKKINRKTYAVAVFLYVILSGAVVVLFLGYDDNVIVIPPIIDFYPFNYLIISYILQILFIFPIIQRSNSFTRLWWLFVWCFVLTQIWYSITCLFDNIDSDIEKIFYIPRIGDFIAGGLLLFYPNKMQGDISFNTKTLTINIIGVLSIYFVFFCVCHASSLQQRWGVENTKKTNWMENASSTFKIPTESNQPNWVIENSKNFKPSKK